MTMQKIVYCPLPFLDDIVDSRRIKKGKKDPASSISPWQSSALLQEIQGSEEPHKRTIFIPGQQGS